MIIKKDIELDMSVGEIWELLTDKEKNTLKDLLYDEDPETFMDWLIEEGRVKQID